MWTAVGDTLPLAAGLALSPVAIATAVLLLGLAVPAGTKRPREQQERKPGLLDRLDGSASAAPS